MSTVPLSQQTVHPSRARAAVTHFKGFVCLQISGIILFFDEYGDKVTKTF
jgi:hypothetical protein